MSRIVLVFLMLFLLSGMLFSQEKGIKEEVKLEGDKVENKQQEKDKKVSVFEIINKFLMVDVKVVGKKFTKEQRAEISGKIESNVKDCFARVLMSNVEYQKKERKYFDSESILKIKVINGTFNKMKILKSKTKSPFVKECLGSLNEFETGYNINTDLSVNIKTRLK